MSTSAGAEWLKSRRVTLTSLTRPVSSWTSMVEDAYPKSAISIGALLV
jgi:hypothetical protein